MICLKGYHRIISNIESPKFLPQVHLQDVFEYNERSGTIFFHTERMLLAGEEQHESGFPRCWVEREIVHPHFWDQFEKAFTNVRRKQELNIPEILLKGKDGTYQWFRLVLRHPGRDQQDLDTVVAVLEPTGAERVMERKPCVPGVSIKRCSRRPSPMRRWTWRVGSCSPLAACGTCMNRITGGAVCTSWMC